MSQLDPSGAPTAVVLSWALLVWFGPAAGVPARALQIERPPVEELSVTIRNRLGTQVDRELSFRDAEGARRTLGEFLDGTRPLLLTMNYYNCAMLCTVELNGLVKGLRGLDWVPGQEFRLVTVSIDHRDSPELAARKQKTYLEALGRPSAEWDFLVGDEDSIRKLADAVGFDYVYDPALDQYSHPAAIFFLSPDGVLTRAISGLVFSPQELRFALMDASKGRLGTPLSRVLLTCFHYDETRGRYAPFAFGIMRIAGAVTAILLAAFLLIMRRRETSHRREITL